MSYIDCFDKLPLVSDKIVNHGQLKASFEYGMLLRVCSVLQLVFLRITAILIILKIGVFHKL